MPLNNISPTIKVTVPATASVLTAASYDYDGATATFAAAVDYQISADGSPVVISNRAISLTGAAPSLSQVGPDGNAYISQGGMKTPIPVPMTYQGWDQYIADDASSGPLDPTPYSGNVNPSLSGNPPVAWAIGERGAYIQSLWRRFGSDRLVDKYIPLVTVIDTPLAAGDFRPGIANNGAARTNYGANVSNINMNVLRNSVATPGICRTLTTCITELEKTKLRPVWHSFSDQARRRYETSNYNDYAQDYAPEIAYDILALHFTNTNALKMQKVLNVIQRAIDLRSVLDQGFLYGIGAGQNANGWVELVYAGFLLGDTDFLDAALLMKTNTTGQSFSPPWAEMIGRNMPFPGDVGSNNIQYTQPWYNENTWMWLAGSHEDSSFKYTGYFMGQDGMHIMEVMAVALLQNGPGGISGEDWLVANGLGHLINQMDDRHAMVPVPGNASRYGGDLRAAFDALRPTVSVSVASRPMHLESGRNTAITDGFRSTFTGYNFSGTAITDRQSRLSIDRRWGPTWTGRSSTTTDTTTGVLLGVPQWEQARMVNAVGAGLWSTIYPDQQDKATLVDFPEPKITPIGSAGTATPVNSHTPKILIRPYSGHAALRLEEFAGGTLPVHARQLYGSVGYWVGGGAPVSFNYKFQEDIATVWTDIAGTDGNIPVTTIGGTPQGGTTWGILDTRLARGKSVRFSVQGISSTGNTSAWVNSSAVTVPARTEVLDYLAPDPAFQLKDLNFRYNATPAITLSLLSTPGQYPSYLMSANSTVAARGIAIDQLPVLGDMSSIPQGEMLAIWSRGLSPTATTRATLNFYMTGSDLASFNCYALEYEATSLGWRHTLWQVTDGVYQATSISGLGAYRPDSSATPEGRQFNNGDSPPHGVYTRLNWSLDGGLLRVKVKSWQRFDNSTQRYLEPAAWQDNWLIPTAPISSGRIGFGMRFSNRDVRVTGIGVSIDPTVSAEVTPRVPAYTY